jgi:hypothetical protein
MTIRPDLESLEQIDAAIKTWARIRRSGSRVP